MTDNESQTFIAKDELDIPLTPVDASTAHTSKPTTKPMSEETKQKLSLSLSITRYSFIGVCAVIIVHTLFMFFKLTDNSNILTDIIDLMKTILLLALGYMFGNQNKEN